MLLFFTLLIVIYLTGIMLSPFPCWPTYRLLWKKVLFTRNASIPLSVRLNQARFLLKSIALCPLTTLLWYLDELLYPEYKQVKIKPVFIIGQPRSGTTFLHRTLAADKQNFIALKHIEWRYPFVLFQRCLKKFAWVKRLTERNYWPDTEEGRLAAKMHPNSLSDCEEDGIFFEECFLHHMFIYLRFPYPELLQHVDSFQVLSQKQQERMLSAHQKAIQKAIYLRGHDESYYLSKEVTSHNKIPSLIKRYPDAKFIISVRHSDDFMSSLLALVRQSTLSKTGVDPMTIPGWEEAFIKRMQEDSLRLRDLCENEINPDRQVRIMFSDFTHHISRSLSLVYEKYGLVMGEEQLSYLKDVEESQADRKRGYYYDVDSFSGFEDFDQFVCSVQTDFEKLMNPYSTRPTYPVDLVAN